MTVERLMQKYGTTVHLCSDTGTEKEFRAFIEPLRYKNKMYLDGVYTQIGFNSQGHYLYIGPPEPDLTQLADGEYLLSHSEKYQIDRAEKVHRGDKVFYIWAIIRTIVEV